MVRDALTYLIRNTDITYLSEGSIARAMVEATSLEVSRLQDFILSQVDKAFLSTSSGLYLDLFGEMLGLPRYRDRVAVVEADDKAIRFYVTSGTLGSRLQSASNPSLAVIPARTTIQNSSGSVVYTTINDTIFPASAKQVYVAATAETPGAAYNVGANQLVIHSLGNSEILVTNDTSITVGADIEPDSEYRFRLSKAMTARYGSNSTAVQLAAISQPGISRVELLQYSRGAGTFDVLLVPQGNRVTRAVLDNTRRAVEQVTAFGVSPRVIEPEYLPFKIAIQLSYKEGTQSGQKLAARNSAQSAILTYLSSIPLGGEVVINQIRSAVLTANSNIRDLQIIELCIDGQPRVIRNIKLRKDEIVLPDPNAKDPIEVI